MIGCSDVLGRRRNLNDCMFRDAVPIDVSDLMRTLPDLTLAVGMCSGVVMW